MKKTLFLVFFMIFSLSASLVFADNSSPESKFDKPAVPEKKENKMTEEEMSRVTKRVEEIRKMDKSNLSTTQKRELRKELKTMKEEVRKNTTVYISVTALLLIIILLIILL